MFFSNLLFILFFPFFLYITVFIGRNLGFKGKFLVLLLIWHTSFCFLYYYMTEAMVSDLTGYWENSFTDSYDFSPGTAFVISLTKIFSDKLGLSIENILLIYNFFGVIGLLLLGHVLLIFWPYKDKLRRNIPYIILLLPGMSFWTSVIGKDSIAFFAVCLALFASINLKKRHYLFILASIVMFAVRPHIAAIMLISMTFSFTFEEKLPFLHKLVLLLIASTVNVSLIRFVLNYSGLGDTTSMADVTDYMGLRQGYNQEGGAGIDISSMSLPEQFFAYLFRPLFFDAPGILGIIVSFENCFTLTIFLPFFIKGIRKVFSRRPPGAIYNLIFLTLGLVVLATTTANLGISIRQKTMLLPSLFYLIALSAYYIKTSKKTKGQGTAKISNAI